MATSKMLCNEPGLAVTEAIDGYLSTRTDLARLDGYPGTKVVLRRRIDRAKVALISGGGAGHEPLHAGFIGEGCLTAAVSGDVFASPHVNAISAAIRGADSSAGTLLIVKNYTGDRLAFGLAREKAAGEGRAVETVYVADDAAVDGGAVTGRRGIAGPVFVHKLAGAVAEAGAPLSAVASVARAVAASVVSIGASLTVCRLPGHAPSSRLDGDAMEVGLGIHGEPGSVQLPAVPSSDALAVSMVDALCERLAHLRGASDATVPVALLINNLGGLSNLEMGVFTTSLRRAMGAQVPGSRKPLLPLAVQRVYCGALVTSTDMRGASVSLLPLDGPLEAALSSSGTGLTPLGALDAPAPLTAWPASHGTAESWGAIATVPMPQAPERVLHEANAASAGSGSESAAGADAPLVRSLFASVTAACGALALAQDALNALDAISGDADAGSTAQLIASAVASGVPAEGSPAHAAALARPLPAALSALLSSACDAVGDAAGGSSGVLYALMLAAAARAASASASPTAASCGSESAATAPPTPLTALAAALDAAVSAASTYGGAKPGDRTMLDALTPAAAALIEAAAAGTEPAAAAAAVAAAAEAGAAATAEMRAHAGRASYVPFERMRGHRDPGAVAAAAWIGAAANAAVQ